MVAAPQRSRGSRRVSASMSGPVERASLRAKPTRRSDADQRGSEHDRRQPALLRTFDDREDHRGEHAPTSTARSADRPAATRDLAMTGNPQRGEQQRDEHDRHVDEEHRAPPEPREQQPADHGAGRGRDARDSRPHRDRLSAFLLREDVADRRQRRRHRARAADAHHAARDRQGRGRFRQRGGDGRSAEDREADHEHALAAGRSPTTASGSSNPASTSPYELPIHWRADLVGVESRARCSGTRPRGSCCR